jgi:hypothetical protein
MTYRKIILLLIGTILLFATVSYGQGFGNKLPIIDKELLKKDFVILRTNLEKIDPALDRYKSQSEITFLFDSCYHELNRNMTGIEFYAKIKFILSAIEDGHLSSDKSAELSSYCEGKARVFPVQIEFSTHNAYVFCDINNSIPKGSEILKINNETIENIRRKLFHYIVSDGSIQTKKTRILSNNFWFYYLLVYGEKPSFRVEYRTPEGKIETVELNSDIQKNIECKSDKLDTGKNLHLTFKPESIACMTIKTFIRQDLVDNKEDFADFLKSAFKQIRKEKIKNLIIDLRDNGGGRDVYGSLLYSYLTDKPFPYYKSLASNDKKLSTEDHPNLKIQNPGENCFTGNVYFLINGMSFSTTTEFCAIAKSNNRGVFIGKETGGGYYGNNSGDLIVVLLPNTKIVVTIPTKKYVMDVKESVFKDRGIIPDFDVESITGDIASDRDIQLEFALQLINKTKNR